MADNFDIAKKIYDAVMELQAQQIRNQTIKPEDIIADTERDFIENLHLSVQHYTKGISDGNVIHNIYINILKRTNHINTKDIMGTSGIKLLDGIIKDCVKNVGGPKIDRNLDNVDGGQVTSKTNIPKSRLDNAFLNMNSIAERMNYYSSLSDSEKREFIKILNQETLGVDLGEAMTQLEELMQSDLFQNGTEKDKNRAIELNNKFNEIFENMGIKSDSIKSQDDRLTLTVLFHKIKSTNDIDEVKDFLKSEETLLKRFGITNIDEFAQRMVNEFDRNLKLTEAKKILDANSKMIEENQEKLQEFLILQLGEEVGRKLKFTDIKRIFLISIDFETGEINPILATNAMKKFAEEHELSTFDEKNFYDAISQERNLLTTERNQSSLPENIVTKDSSITPEEIPKHEDEYGSLYDDLTQEIFAQTNEIVIATTADAPDIVDENGSLHEMPGDEDDIATPKEENLDPYEGLFDALELGLFEQMGGNIKNEPDELMDRMMTDMGETLDTSAITDMEQVIEETPEDVSRTNKVEETVEAVIIVTHPGIVAGKIAEAAINMASKRKITTEGLTELIPMELVRTGKESVQEGHDDIDYSD